ncbi:ComF family protein [Parapedobacter sp. 10938]|uniref:ComF family protein n=1 Tax=Parapedobacter flavus TaxID=3110225 RepID=UPI002DBFB2C3|nr:phosphoribosyltransferase family protein [Parapedobacter sp. 10938]MEC3879973.1 phosphoribosyltransferase family protein [Parapedobacter sp. 10938]
MGITRYFSDFTALFFAQTCAGCDAPLVNGEKHICTTCWYRLPDTRAHEDEQNSSARQLWGRVCIESVASYWYFREASRVKRIIHHLKYRNRPEIGTVIGQRYGAVLVDTAPFNQADIIVPVPLHPKKLRARGYNQSTFFANGLAHSMHLPVAEHGIVRRRATESQTRRNRYERYENMLETFVANDVGAIADRHVLLVDDVLTTGATLEACASSLLENGAAKVSAVTIAKAL